MKHIHFPHIFSGKKHHRLFRAAALILSVSLAAAPVTVLADSDYKLIYTPEGLEDYYGETAANKKMAIQTNKVPSWPKGPKVGAAGAVVMDADSGTVLYGKNQEMRLYPASITKVMTGLLACENLSASDTITFSENAVFGIEQGSSNIGMDVGESISVDQALYGLMVASANEVAVALGERVSGSESDFIDLMNQRAGELGCVNTHFVTANGLHDEEHYSCAYDMALIAREAFRHPELVEYMSQANYHFEASDTQPDDFWLANTNDFLNGSIPCEDVIGGKTGYTDQSRETLVTFASRDGMNLICVIMREEPPYQYYDTIDLLDYAFENFQKIRISEIEDRFTLQSGGDFLRVGEDIFGNSDPFYTISPDDFLTIPKSASFEDLSAEILPADTNPSETETADTAEDLADPADPDGTEESSSAATTGQAAAVSLPSGTRDNEKNTLGVVEYKYHDYPVGTAEILFSQEDSENSYKVHGIRGLAFSLLHTGIHDSVYLNILLLIPIVLALAFLLCVIFFIHGYFAEINRKRRSKTRRARQTRTEQDDRIYDDGSPSGSGQRRTRTQGTQGRQGQQGRTRTRQNSRDRQQTRGRYR